MSVRSFVSVRTFLSIEAFVSVGSIVSLGSFMSVGSFVSVGSFLPPNGFVIAKYDVCVLALLYLLSITIPPSSLILTEVVISLSVVALIL